MVIASPILHHHTISCSFFFAWNFFQPHPASSRYGVAMVRWRKNIPKDWVWPFAMVSVLGILCPSYRVRNWGFPGIVVDLPYGDSWELCLVSEASWPHRGHPMASLTSKRWKTMTSCGPFGLEVNLRKRFGNTKIWWYLWTLGEELSKRKCRSSNVFGRRNHQKARKPRAEGFVCDPLTQKIPNNSAVIWNLDPRGMRWNGKHWSNLSRSRTDPRRDDRDTTDSEGTFKEKDLQGWDGSVEGRANRRFIHMFVDHFLSKLCFYFSVPEFFSDRQKWRP